MQEDNILVSKFSESAKTDTQQALLLKLCCVDFSAEAIDTLQKARDKFAELYYATKEGSSSTAINYMSLSRVFSLHIALQKGSPLRTLVSSINRFEKDQELRIFCFQTIAQYEAVSAKSHRLRNPSPPSSP